MSRQSRFPLRRLESLDDRLLPSAVAAVGTGGGAPPIVNVYNSDETMERSFEAYDSHFTGGVHVAMADVNGDGVKDIITAPGPGGGPHIKVFDGVTGALIFSFMAYDPAFRGGAWVAGGDVNGDGKADIITGAGDGGGPHVEVFSGANGALLRSFFAYDPAFRGGVTVAAGDVNGDGIADIITGAGQGGGPHVKVFDGVSGATIASFFAYDPSFRGGVFVGAGRLIAGTSTSEIITGPGVGGGPHVEMFSATGSLLESMIVYNSPFTGGVRVAAADVAGSDTQCICTGPGDGYSPFVQGIDGATHDTLYHYLAFDPIYYGGVFVG
jgi:hypothetical protein